MKSYEYKDDGRRVLCKQHHMLRCSECDYVDGLKQQNNRYEEKLEEIEVMGLRNINLGIPTDSNELVDFIRNGE